MSKLVIVIDENYLPAKSRYWKVDAVFELTPKGDGFYIEKCRNVYYDEQRVCPLPISELISYIYNKDEAQDHWLVKDGYL